MRWYGFPSRRVPPCDTLYAFSPLVVLSDRGRDIMEQRVLLETMRRALGAVMWGKSISMYLARLVAWGDDC